VPRHDAARHLLLEEAMTKKSQKKNPVVLNERQLSVASGGWIGGAGLGVAAVGQTPADGQPQTNAMDGYVRG
jgi:hypothetical protein